MKFTFKDIFELSIPLIIVIGGTIEYLVISRLTKNRSGKDIATAMIALYSIFSAVLVLPIALTNAYGNASHAEKINDLRRAGYTLTNALVNASSVVYYGNTCTETFDLAKLDGRYILVYDTQKNSPIISPSEVHAKLAGCGISS